MIAETLNKRKPFIQVKPWMAQLIWRVEAVKNVLFGKDPLVTKEAASSALSKVYYSNKKLKNALNFEFNPIQEAVNHSGGLFLKDYSSDS